MEVEAILGRPSGFSEAKEPHEHVFWIGDQSIIQVRFDKDERVQTVRWSDWPGEEHGFVVDLQRRVKALWRKWFP
jgi:hypothetical protein